MCTEIGTMLYLSPVVTATYRSPWRRCAVLKRPSASELVRKENSLRGRGEGHFFTPGKDRQTDSFGFFRGAKNNWSWCLLFLLYNMYVCCWMVSVFHFFY